MQIILTRREALDYPDGINIFVVSLAQTFMDLGHRVMIIAASMRSEDEYRQALAPRRHIPVLALSQKPLRGIASAGAWWRATRAIARLNPSLVINNEVIPLPMRGTKVQVVHDLEPRRRAFASIGRSIRRFSTRRSDNVVATTTELRDELVRDLGMPRDQIKLIPKCVDRQSYHGADHPMRMRAILHAGTEAYKRPEVTIQAFGALNDPSVELYVTGKVTSAVQDAMSALPEPLRHHLKLLGAAPGNAVRALQGQALISAFPTRYTIPVGSATVMEAIASGTPIVGSARISRDLVQDGANGLVTEPAPGPMANAFRIILDNTELWARLSRGAVCIAERFDSIRVAKQYLELARGR
jgi:glycosyltransferase involved in cell wall biosynthesis